MGEGFWPQGLHQQPAGSSAPAVPSPTHSPRTALAAAAFWRWARGPRPEPPCCSPVWQHNLGPCRRSRDFACRGKTARVINYEEFKKALEELAPKRFKDKSKDEAYEAICQLVAGKEPINVGVTVSEEPPSPLERDGGWEGRTELRPQRKCFPGDPTALGVTGRASKLEWGNG